MNGLPGYPQVIAVTKLEHERVNFGGVWHSDTTYLERPPLGSVLYAVEVPPYGGDTLFANQYVACFADGSLRLRPGEPASLAERLAVNAGVGTLR